MCKKFHSDNASWHHVASLPAMLPTNTNHMVSKKTIPLACGAAALVAMASNQSPLEVYFVFMNFDPEYERLQMIGSKQGTQELDAYLSNKHNRLLAKLLQPNTYKKRSSLAIVDGFAVEMTQEQAAILRAAKEVRVVEKDQELA